MIPVSAELLAAVRSAPVVRAPGDLVVRTHFDGDAPSYEIIHADPLVEISLELLEHLNPALATLDGDVLTVTARNRTVIYRVLRQTYDPLKRTVLAEWPD